MTQIWSYTPEIVLTEALTTSVRISPVAPQSDVTGFLVDTAVRGWRLQHATVDTATCNSMVAFYEAVEAALRIREVPQTRSSRTDYREAGLLSANRE